MRASIAVAAIAALFAIEGYSLDPQAVQATPKPELRLIVSTANIDVPMTDGLGLFRVDAQASESFAGAVSGSISIAEPTNPERLSLADGSASKTIPFTLRAGQRISDVQPQRNLMFWIKTSPANSNPGGLVYTVFLNPSIQFTPNNSVKQVRVTVVDGHSDRPCPDPFSGCGPTRPIVA